MATYIIIGGDQKEYGPITAEDVGLWIGEGRLNEHSSVKKEGEAEFRALGSFPEFSGAFAAKPFTPPPFGRSPGSSNWAERDYDLDIGGCISRGWELLKNNFSTLFVGALIYTLVEGGMSGLANIPFVGAIFSIINFIIVGPLTGGLLYLFIRALRGEPAEIGDVFSGFRRAFGQLFLGTLVQGLFIGLFLLPFLIVFIWKIIPVASHLQSNSMPDKEMITAIQGALFASLPVLLICIIPIIYLSVCWKFTLALIVDRQMNFWEAMGTSRKMVSKHWWLVFGLVILISLLNLAGFCACCIGVLFTMPIGIAALMIAYETIFSERQAA